ncbi:HlyD family efflux transporter periplasmic adaptor subunit [Moraxella oblonga]|uniref:HlyD family efflux transporter periplasmic adaptor subunit n=1 Tax=Moraxella oblonga TaxID=200413 RepID=UPI00083512A8|nr:HlyD family efflux transporter periplasmic adaptor subunit [Moraxella oblonga]
MFRLIFVLFLWCLTACQPATVKVTDLDSFDNQSKRDGLVHGNLKILPPTDQDNAKITIDNQSITLTKAHILGIKSELYQPSFRLEGVISPINQSDVLLPETASLNTLYVKIGDVVEMGDKLALFYHNTFINHSPYTQSVDDEHGDKDDVIKNIHQTKSTITQRAVPILSTHTGRVHTIYLHNQGQTYPKDTPIISIIDDSQLKFISVLPHDFKEYLSIGSAVNFNTDNAKTFSGQIEQVVPDPLIANTLNVHVVIKPSEIQKAQLTLGERVSGHVNYGQKSVGVLVPAFAIFDDKLEPMDLSDLQHPPFKPATPIHAQMWVIKQDERLYLTPIQVIQYHPQSDHYLIHGVSLTGLVVLADLPKTAQGKKVRLK